jgi:hypothetical protein
VGAALLGGAAGLGADGAILLFSGAGAVTRLAGLEWTLRATGAAPGAGLVVVAREVALAAPLVLGLLGARRLGLGPIASIAVAAALIGILAAVRLRRGRAGSGPAPSPSTGEEDAA